MATLMTEISRRQTCRRDGVSVTRVVEVEPYTAWKSICASLLGGVRLIGGGLFRVPPFSDPYLPWAFVKSVDVEGVGIFAGTGAALPAVQLASANYYRRARMTINYESLDVTADEMNNTDGNSGSGNPTQSETPEIELASSSMEVSNETINIPARLLRFKYSSSLSLNKIIINPIKVYPKMKTVFVRHFVINRPLSAIFQLTGKVNYASFRIGTVTYPSETLRFDGANLTQKITNLGVKYFEIQYTFAVQPVYDKIATSAEVLNATDPKIVTTPSTTSSAYVGWNRMYRTDRGYWDRIYSWDSTTATRTANLFGYDTDVYQNLPGAVSGFKLLFHPRAV